ncbi:meiotically up-regulated gene family-domain-containing protein [Dactylonectria estremocensis]|uniref:Meiotically up-regulated gene family-domain-containing protein n=1 Tax=Dactylonectria estremocensis TaxID=1079267 RepID=A0A9P9J3B4_9HYPO|nr:meiotically up-regulated gene family-domain-containing protein [Dactylonectria estremocensis]
MLPSLAIAAASLLFSGTQAAVPPLLPRLAVSSNSSTTPIPEPPIDSTPGFTSTASLTVISETTDSTESTIEAVTTATTTVPTNTNGGDSTPSVTGLPIGSNGGITISGVLTLPSATLPTSFQTTGTAAVVAIGAIATDAESSFSNVAAAASSIAANPSPSEEDIRAFEQLAQDEFEQLSSLETQLDHVDQNSLSDHDSEIVAGALLGLAALLGWYTLQLAALAPALATPATAAAVFAELAPAFATAVTAGLLANALAGLGELGNNNDDGDDNDDDDNDPTTTQETTAVSSTETETETSTTASSTCSALPYRLSLPDEIDEGNSDNFKRSIAGRIRLEERATLEKRAKRFPFFGDCNPPAGVKPAFPGNPGPKALAAAESSGGTTNANYNRDVAKWFDRVVSCTTLTPSFDQIDTAAAKAKPGALANFNVDHAWELKFFTDFFESLLPGPRSSDPKLTCAEFDAIFPVCILTTVVNQVPGPSNAEFVAMQKDLNNMKGAMFKPTELANDFFTASFSGSTDTKIQALQSIGITVDIFNLDLVKNLFERTNQRMYNTFQGIDQRVVDKSIAIATPDFNFAASYETFMADRLTKGSQEAWEFVQKWMGIVEADIAALDPEEEETKQLQKNYDGFKDSPYASEGHYSFRANTALAGAGGTPFPFPKRDLWARDGSCPLNQETSTAIAESTTQESTASGFSTETATQTPSQEPTVGTDQTSTVLSTATTLSTFTLISQTPSSTFITVDQTASEITPIVSEQPTSTGQVTESQASTSTRHVPNVQTVTTDGMVCVLIEGSLNPQCRPLSVPTANPDGTNIHVNSGCITINGSPRCASDAGNIASFYESSYNVASDPEQPYSTALILSGFDSSNDNRLHASATCQLQARWPANYGDVYFGQDGCLYDSGSNKIFDQCCSTPDVNNNGPTTNPYVAPAPPDASQSSGNHDGSSICSSFSKDTCLAAASRYVDDVVYHQYTSAVWPDSTGADIANAIFPIAGPFIEDLFGIDYGCTVIWTCDDDDAFSQGMTGKQIKDSMLNIYNLNGAKGCGSTYLDNRCHITVNGCNNCRDAGRDGTIWNPYSVADGTYADANDGFPPRR